MSHKLISRFLFSAKVLFVASIAAAQVDSINVVTSAVPFLKGQWEVETQKYLWGSRFNEKLGDVDQGSLSRFRFNGVTHYWFSNKIAGGLELNYDATTSKNGSEIKSSEFVAYGYLTYGINMKNDWGIYWRAGAGVGSGKIENGSQEIKSDIFSYKFEFGAPIHMSNQLFIVPYLNYKNTSEDFDGVEQNEGRFQVAVKFVSYLDCGNEFYDDTTGIPWPRRYAQGNSYLGVHSMTGYSFGSRESKTPLQSNKDDLNRFNLKVDYVYEILPNLGLGADLGYRSMVTKSEDFDFKVTSSSFTFTPKFIWNFPTNNWLNDFFLTGGYGFGSQKEKNTISGNTSEVTDKLTTWNGALGYNWWLSKYSMFTFQFGYEQETLKPKDDDEKTKFDGISYQIGFRTQFPSLRSYGGK